ncbi:lisH domain-containing protein ARMC9 [Calliopsis andreniformis]|uniref:lisH domain-containing protein ARMC9 n=1 Tax=Calliopsis andreniformis TaxID=337506 RepID=UPI003FCDFD15
MDKDMQPDAINQMDNMNLRFIYQFLVDNNFQNAAEALTTEAATKGFKHLQEESKPINEIYSNSCEQILLSYKSGDWRTFFKLWNLLIPEDVKQTRACKILTLNLHVYFTMIPKRTLFLHWYKERDKTQLEDSVTSMMFSNQQNSENEEHLTMEIEKNMNDSMEELRIFLNTTGKELENDTQLRPFFALPFIEDPYAEPSLSRVFEKSWIDELTENLYTFLNTYRKQNSTSTRDNDLDLNQISSNHESLSEESRKDSMKKTLENINVPIIPNDRNIPLILEDDNDDVEYVWYNDIKYSQRSKSIQTVSMNSTNEGKSAHLTKNDKKLMECSQELSVTKSHLCSVHSNYEKLKVRFHKLHTDYHKLMSIARILTTALENSARGHIVDFQAMLESCIKTFPDLFNQNIKDSSNTSSELQLDKLRSDMKVIEHSMPNVTPVPPKLLNFRKIKLHLINGNIKTKLFLLQALRRKITFGQPGERDEAVHEYISRDLLGLHGQIASYKGKSILPYLLTPEDIIMPHPLQQSTTRLLNTLASFRCGRDYLSFDSTVVDMVFKCLNSISDNDVDTLTCNMMIAMLQKLSVRRQQRIYMIENGLVEWLIHHLHNQCRIIDSYRLEYATALLMNLSLHQTAQLRASAIASLLVSTLITLLLMDHTSTTPYINGALNNFLLNHTINEEAKKMNLSSVIEQYTKHKTGETRKYLDYTLQIHKGEINTKRNMEEMIDNDNEEFDVLEYQLEENDPVKNNYGELCGESLLAASYTISSKISQEKEINLDISAQKQCQTNTVDSPTQDNDEQVKHSYQRESISHRKHLLRKHEVKNKNNITTAQESIKGIDSCTSLNLSKKHCKNSIPNAQIKLQQFAINMLKNRQSKGRGSEIYNESAVYLYENQSSKDSSKTTIASSMILGIESEAESTVMEKLSSIASLNINNDNQAVRDDILWIQETDIDKEDAFLPKPKLPRTPP